MARRVLLKITSLLCINVRSENSVTPKTCVTNYVCNNYIIENRFTATPSYFHMCIKITKFKKLMYTNKIY